FRHGNVEDVDVLLADQVQQQVERTFEGLEENLQRIRRDVQVQRQLVEGFTVDQRQPQLLAWLDCIGLGRGWLHVRSKKGQRPVNGNSSPWPAALLPAFHALRRAPVRRLR